MSDKDKKNKGEDEPEDDVDEAPPPQQFQRPKWLLDLAKEKASAGGDVELKSGSASGTPPPLEGTVAPPKPPAGRSPHRAPPKPATPPTADVRVERPQGLPPERLRELAGPSADSAHVKMDKPPAARPSDALKRLEAAASEAHVKMDKPQAAAPSPEMLRRLAEAAAEAQVKIDRPAAPKTQMREIDPASVHVKKPPTEAERPKPVVAAPSEFDVVVDAHAKNPRSERLKVTKPHKSLGIVDTTFARTDMGAVAIDELQRLAGDYELVRRTVPGIKDLAVECKILIEEEDCDLVIACGMVGAQPIDKQCAHEASLAIQWAMLATNRHILEVFVHEDEAKDEAQLAWLIERRTREHAENAHWMLTDAAHLTQQAGRGLRQGFDDAGPISRP